MIKKILILLVVGAVAAFFVYKYAMRPVADTSEIKPDVSITFTDINSKMNASDTATLNAYTSKVISVNGNIKSITKDSTITTDTVTIGNVFKFTKMITTNVTIIIGDTSTNNTIICQGDSRHVFDFKSFLVNQNATIKGICAGCDGDDMGLGNSLQLKNCVISK